LDNRGQQGADIKLPVKVLGKMVQCPEMSDFTIRWISEARFLTSLDLLAANKGRLKSKLSTGDLAMRWFVRTQS